MYNVQYIYIYIFSIKQLTSGLLQILPSDWLSYSLSIGDRPLVAKGVDFHIQNNLKNTCILPRSQLIFSK